MELISLNLHISYNMISDPGTSDFIRQKLHSMIKKAHEMDKKVVEIKMNVYYEPGQP
jgi:hypothetical protein